MSDCTDKAGWGASKQVKQYLELVGSCTKIEVGDAEIAYHQFGAGPPLVLLMGFLGTMPGWTPGWLSELAQSFRVTIYDHPGIGKSDYKSKTKLSVDVLADTAVGLIHNLGLTRPAILGWSMGADTSLVIGIRHGDAVGKIVAVSPNPGGDENVTPDKKIEKKLNSMFMSAKDFVELMYTKGQKKAKNAYIDWDKDVNKSIKSEKVKLGPASAYDKVEKEWFKGPGIFSQLSQIRNEVLLVTGADDIITPPQNSRNLHQQIPNSQLLEVPDAGHAVLFQGDGSIPQIRSFLS